MVIKLSQQKNDPYDRLKVIILCAGEGTRISDFIPNIPKPLIEINTKPLLSHLISHLLESNIKSIVLVTGHLKEQIENYIKKIYQKNELMRKILLINSGNDYKKGPLYSFLSITKEKSILRRNLLYLVFPGDTYFEFPLIRELITEIKNSFAVIHDKSFIFYQELRGIRLKEEEDPSKIVSTIKTEDLGSMEIVRSIEQLKLEIINDKQFYKRVIPVFVFSYEFLESIIDAEKSVSVRKIREIVNLLISGKNNLYALRLNSNYRFFDIDTKLDLINLKQK
jgi:NDP-sugar pyrophosphorylase family protein